LLLLERKVYMKGIYYIENEKIKLKINHDGKLPPKIPASTPMHNHGNAEIHIVLINEITCVVNGEEYKLKVGDAIFIPAGTFHYVKSSDKRSAIAFQVDSDITEVMQKKFSQGFIDAFWETWKNGESITNYFVFICNEFFDFITRGEMVVDNYKYTIGEFFARNYNYDVRVSDLAKKLHLSEMQTQRLVKKYTGKTFVENLRAYRINVADYLMGTTDMTKEEISKYVGYASYNGFWKAQQKGDNPSKEV